MPAFDLTTASSAGQQVGEETAALFEQIAAIMSYDSVTGALNVREADLRNLLAGAMPPNSASALTDNLIEVAQGGLLKLGSSGRRRCLSPK